MKTALQIGLTALLVGALAFYGGVTYGKSAGSAGGAAAFTRRGAAGQAGQDIAQRMRGGFANGEIIAADAKSITVKSADGSTKTVYLDPSTRVLRSSEATLTDVAKGATVVVVGSSADDGSVTARSVQIVPKGSNLALFGGGMRFGGGQNGAASGSGKSGGTQRNIGGGDAGGPPVGDVAVPPPGF